MTQNVFNDLWNEISETQLSENNSNNDEITLEYNQSGSDFVLVQSMSFNKTHGELRRTIRFTIDFGSIQHFLNLKGSSINLSSDETRKNLVADILRKFHEVKPMIGAFNGKNDLCEELAVFFINSRGSIASGNFGI